jgi:hypothetical protein
VGLIVFFCFYLYVSVGLIKYKFPDIGNKNYIFVILIYISFPWMFFIEIKGGKYFKSELGFCKNCRSKLLNAAFFFGLIHAIFASSLFSIRDDVTKSVAVSVLLSINAASMLVFFYYLDVVFRRGIEAGDPR